MPFVQQVVLNAVYASEIILCKRSPQGAAAFTLNP